MDKRCCGNCAYATRLWGRWLRIIMAGWSGLRICFNSDQSPGRMQEVYPTGSCRNFRPRPVEQHRAKRRDHSSNVPRPKEDTRLIPLGHGVFAIVDAADYEWLSQYKWSLYGPGYAARHAHGTTIYMHREIMQAPPGMDVDHINGSRSDNRRSNLRVCTRPQNLRNAGKRPGCLSQYKGVAVDRRYNNRCFARIWFEGRTIALGYFNDEVEAALAYDRAALKLFGEYAWLNFPEEIETRRREIATPQYQKELAERLKKRKPPKRQASHTKAALRKSRATTPRRKPDKRKRKRSMTKATRRRRVRIAHRSS